MYGIFVNSAKVNYAGYIVSGKKTIETRSSNTLKKLVGRRVAVIETGKGPAQVIGYVDITHAAFCLSIYYEAWRNETMIPAGDKYDRFGTRDGVSGKWFYDLENAEKCTPYELPDNAIRHGRSWCEFELN